jgi:organic radical activating enzyme
MKFRFLKIDLESKTTYTCHAAQPHSVDFNWLSNNSGQLFNTPVNVSEREMMLVNRRNNSCEQNCWRAEDAGATSPRMYQGGEEKTHFEIKTQPEIVDLTIGSDCNLTCSYCCKEFSSSWRRDLTTNGSYSISNVDKRFELTTKDEVLMKLSQTELKSTKHYQLLLEEIKKVAPGLKKLIITGGEPFLDNQLIDVLAEIPFSNNIEIQLYTGMGVNSARFERILEKLKLIKNFYLTVSAECTDKLHEFNRYGSSWQDFENKLALLESHRIEYRFQSTLSNLTIFGFVDFANRFKNKTINVTFAYQPDMMSPYVLDSASKQAIIEQIQSLPDTMRQPIEQSLLSIPTEKQRQNIKKFLNEFVSRREDLDVSIYPKTFLNWIDYVV